MKTEEIKEAAYFDVSEAVREFITTCELNGDIEDEIWEELVKAVNNGSDDRFPVRI